jgi:hypothetical protein
VNLFQSIWNWIALNVTGKITWNFLKGKRYWDLTDKDLSKVRNLCSKNYYIILIRRKTHLTTYLISLGNFLLTGKFSYWSHAAMNIDTSITLSDEDFDFMEATGAGVHFSRFMQMFDCDAVCLLRPKGFTDENWTQAIDKMISEKGKPYDTLFDISNQERLSCVELVRVALQNTKGYTENFSSLEGLISKANNLTPQMFYDCLDFEKVLEIRR